MRQSPASGNCLREPAAGSPMVPVELIAADAVPAPAVRASLQGWFTTIEGGQEMVERVYYDTFNGLLHQAGMTLMVERGQMVLNARDGAAEPVADRFPAPPPARLDIDALVDGPLRAALAPIVGVRALLEIARVNLEVETIAVLDEREKTVVRLLRESPVGLRDRIRLLPMRGYRRECDRVAELLSGSHSLEVAPMPLVDEAVIAAGGDPAGIGSGLDVPLDSGEAADEAVARVLTRLTEVRNANLPGVMENLDNEFLHDYRVALRRTRAVVREFKGVFAPELHGWLSDELRWLQVATGETRDLDVYLQDFAKLRELAPVSMRDDLAPLLEELAERRLTARASMLEALRSERAEVLGDRWGLVLSSLAQAPVANRPDAKAPVDQVASRSIRQLYRRIIRMGRAIDTSSPPQDYHELRKQGKELRYMLELFGRPLHDPDVVRSLIRSLKSLQDVLGRHQDREVQIETLRTLADAVVRRPGGPAALLAMGAMIDQLEADAAESRASFHRRFELFSSSQQRRLVRETFSS